MFVNLRDLLLENEEDSARAEGRDLPVATTLAGFSARDVSSLACAQAAVACV